MPNVHELIRDHVTLSIRCLDRLYLHAYLPKLQTSGGLCYFLRDHLGHPIPSPALFAPMLDRFVGAIKTYATTQDVPLITFERGQRKDDVVADYRARRPLDDGVVVIGVAQEKMRAFKAHKRSGPQGGVTFDFSRQSVAVNHYYFYVQDPEWGPAFLKFGTYRPLSDQAVSQRPRVGEATAAARRTSPLTVSTTAFSLCRRRRVCKRSAISSGRPTCRRSSIAGRRGCRRR